MRHIYQRYASDCFPTCIAMVSDISHQKAVKIIHPFRRKGDSYATSDSRAIQVLKRLGFKFKKRSLIMDISKLEKTSLLVLSVEDQGHVAVWDPIQKRVLDPSKISEGFPVSFYQEYLDYALILI